LRALLPFWVQHNEEHTVEFLSWAKKASSAGHEGAAQLICRAAEEMQQASEALRLALAELGGLVAVELPSHAH
jgi:hypothetical protein